LPIPTGTSANANLSVNCLTMTEQLNIELLALIEKHAKQDGVNETIIPGVSLFRASKLDDPVPSVYNPCLCIIIQGEKDVVLNGETYHYSPSQYLTIAVDLPMMNQITQASKDRPYLLIKIDIDTQQLMDLLVLGNYSFQLNSRTARGIFVGRQDKLMFEGVVRLARLLDSPHDVPILATQTLREILYRVLSSEYGEVVAQTTITNSYMFNIANVIRKIKANFREQIAVETLAEVAGMSISSFHANFKLITSMSPIQYQKTLRLIEARRLMTFQAMDAAHAAHQVGYQSASQFSREYKRMFGQSPARDIGGKKQSKSHSVAN